MASRDDELYSEIGRILFESAPEDAQKLFWMLSYPLKMIMQNFYTITSINKVRKHGFCRNLCNRQLTS